MVDRHLLAQAVGHDIESSQAWVVGPDAESRLVGALALGAVAVALLAASGSRARSIALAQLRAAGTPRAAAARVAWLEAAAPTVVASTVGVASGLGLGSLLVVALNLTSVTGGLHAPAVVIPWWTLAIPVALGLVARVVVAVAALSHRAERLGLLMRAG